VNKAPIGIFAALVAFSLAGFAYSHAANLHADFIARPASLLVLAVGCYAAFGPVVYANGSRALAALASVMAIGAVFELVGLATGFPFGHYRYTDRWWPTVHLPVVGNYPLQLPFAWVLVVGAAYLSVASLRWSVVVAAVLAMLVDGIMEATMTHALDYWTWEPSGPLPGSAPISNALAWFGVSLLAAWAMRAILLSPTLAQTSRSENAARRVLGLYFLMIVGLNLIYGRG
jgi:uncharacterized membrane protein